MTKLEQVARVICYYPTGPSDLNSCCQEPMGEKRYQLKARAAVEELRDDDSDGNIVNWNAALDAILSDNPE